MSGGAALKNDFRGVKAIWSLQDGFKDKELF